MFYKKGLSIIDNSKQSKCEKAHSSMEGQNEGHSTNVPAWEPGVGIWSSTIDWKMLLNVHCSVHVFNEVE